MEDELEPGLEPEETPEGAAPETEAAPSNVPTFDPEAERARIREEETARIQTEMEARYRPTQTATEAQANQPPDRYEDPEAYDRWRDEQTEKRIMDRVAPLLGVVNQNTIEQRFRAAGVGDAGLAEIRKTVPNLNATDLQGPGFDLLVNAGKYIDIQKQGTRMAPERPYGERGSADITEDDRKMYGIGTQYGPTEAEVRAWKKEEQEMNRR